MLDIRTLVVVTGITSLMLCVIMFVTVRSYAANSRAALLIWACGQGVQPLGWFLIAQRGQIPDALSFVLGNVLIVAGFNACIHALDVFTARAPRHAVFGSLVLLNLVVTSAFTLWPVSPHMRLIGLSLVMILVFALATQAVIIAGGRSAWGTPSCQSLDCTPALPRCRCADARRAHRLAADRRGTRCRTHAFVSSRMEQFVFAYTSFINIIGSFGFLLICTDRLNAELTRLAAEDSLTGAYNRRTFGQLARNAFDHARRGARPLALLVIDGDHFKHINDEHGHAAGDDALRTYVRTFRDALRQGDALGRVGGEEFTALLPECDEHQAGMLGERMRAAVEACTFVHEGRVVPLRVSVGVAEMRPTDGDFETLLRRADRALYAAKRGGRNRVVAASVASADAQRAGAS